MYFAQHYLDCLSQATYLIGDEHTGNAVVVDPRRDVQDFLEDAEQHGLRIVGVINTHFHADFLAGHLEMAEATGAWIGYGSTAEADYPIRRLADGERIDLGDGSGVQLEVMHTPGHTPESISVLVRERASDEVPYGVLTGDALFIGDVGRPDLLASLGVTAEELADMLYDSVQRKLMGLPDAVRVFPAHGAGSACGKNLSTEKQSTIGEQRRFNYACQPMPKEQFVALVTADQPSAPDYFVYDATLNRKVHDTFDASAPELGVDQAMEALAGGAILLDARDQTDFTAGHLRGSLSVPLDGRFAETAGMLLDPTVDVVVVAPDGHEAEAVTRLARIGFDNVIGYLPGVESVLAEYCEPAGVGHASRLTPAQLEEARADPARPVTVVDLRNPGEVAATGTVPGALRLPLAELPRRLGELSRTGPLVVYCAGGWRSSVGAAFLRSRGFGDVSDLLGGFSAWEASREPVDA